LVTSVFGSRLVRPLELGLPPSRGFARGWRSLGCRAGGAGGSAVQRDGAVPFGGGRAAV